MLVVPILVLVDHGTQREHEIPWNDQNPPVQFQSPYPDTTLTEAKSLMRSSRQFDDFRDAREYRISLAAELNSRLNNYLVHPRGSQFWFKTKYHGLLRAH